MNFIEDKKIRRRAANFSKVEEGALLFLIRKYKDQVDPKNSNKIKEQAWYNIAEEFNALPSVRGNARSAQILRNKYCNLKKIRRRMLMLQAKAKDVVIKGHPEEQQESFEAPEDIDEILDLKEEMPETPEEKRHNHSPIPCPSTPNIDESSRMTLMDEPHEEDFMELQKRCFLEEHGLKLQHMQEKHDRALKIQEEEAEERLRQMREEHRLQMEILQLRKQCLLK